MPALVLVVYSFWPTSKRDLDKLSFWNWVSELDRRIKSWKKIKPEVDISTVQIWKLYQFSSYTLAYSVSGLLNVRSFSRFYWPFDSDSSAFVVQLIVSFKDSKHPTTVVGCFESLKLTSVTKRWGGGWGQSPFPLHSPPTSAHFYQCITVFSNCRIIYGETSPWPLFCSV